MAKREKPTQPVRPEGERPSTRRDVVIPPGGLAQVDYSDEPPSAPPDKRIHPRRPLPPVPDD